MSLPRPEYPRPQFVRADWLCLNGPWQFEIDSGDTGLDRGLKDRELTGSIIVPFCPESELSGLQHTDIMNVVWYRRTVTLPENWAGKRILLHFGACDYDTTVWANDQEVARHRGGFTPFTADLTPALRPGEPVTIVVRARDKHGVPKAKGKQADQYAPHGCLYTRTTGIWQTVWLEPVPTISFKRPRITPDVGNSRFEVVAPLTAFGAGPNRPGLKVRATLTDEQGTVSITEARADIDFAPRLLLPVPDNRRRLWSIGDPHLYDLRLELLDGNGNVVDTADCYAGLRSVTLDGLAVKINGEIVFQRLVLDQGYWPESVMTAPSDAELIADIERGIAAGFNGARLHQKVFEERYLYWADKLGYLVWGEFGDWGCNGYGPPSDQQKMDGSYITQWLEAIDRDYNHPSIIGWCPLNETWQHLGDPITQLDDITRGMWLATKAMDQTRPVLDTSGYAHRVLETDIYDSHDYDQNPVTFKTRHDALLEGNPYISGGWDGKPTNFPYNGQPYFVSEFGGIWWNPAAFDNTESWGYGERVKTIAEFYARFQGLCDALLDDPAMFGYCYTQLTDVYPEENGLYTFGRESKFDLERIRKVQIRKAAIEDSSK